MIVTLGQVLREAQSNDVLGITDRALTIGYINRAIEIAAYKANWNPWMGTLDVCSDECGYVTLPSFVDVVLAANVGGQPAMFRNSWFEFHINGLGDRSVCGAATGVFWEDKMWSPVFRKPKDWVLLAAICEDPIDGDGSKSLIVEGETMDAQMNGKQALTIPSSGPSLPGVRVTLLNGIAATDPGATYFRNITRVTKPVTRGYVKLLAFAPVQNTEAVTLGYYAPNETAPWYKRMRVSCKCDWVRIRYRRKTMALVNDYDVVPISSLQAMVLLLKSLRFSDTNNMQLSDMYEQKAVRLLSEIQTTEDGPNFGPIQVDPSFGVGTIDYR